MPKVIAQLADGRFKLDDGTISTINPETNGISQAKSSAVYNPNPLGAFLPKDKPTIGPVKDTAIVKQKPASFAPQPAQPAPTISAPAPASIQRSGFTRNADAPAIVTPTGDPFQQVVDQGIKEAPTQSATNAQSLGVPVFQNPFAVPQAGASGGLDRGKIISYLKEKNPGWDDQTAKKFFAGAESKNKDIAQKIIERSGAMPVSPAPKAEESPGMLGQVGGFVADSAKFVGQTGLDVLGGAVEQAARVPGNIVAGANQAVGMIPLIGPLLEDKKLQEDMRSIGDTGANFIKQGGLYDPNSYGASAGRLATDVGASSLLAAPAIGLKAAQGAGTLAKMGVGALQGAIGAQAGAVAGRGELASGGELAAGTLLGGAIPGVASAIKGTKGVASDVIGLPTQDLDEAVERFVPTPKPSKRSGLATIGNMNKYKEDAKGALGDVYETIRQQGKSVDNMDMDDFFKAYQDTEKNIGKQIGKMREGGANLDINIDDVIPVKTKNGYVGGNEEYRNILNDALDPRFATKAQIDQAEALKDTFKLFDRNNPKFVSDVMGVENQLVKLKEQIRNMPTVAGQNNNKNLLQSLATNLSGMTDEALEQAGNPGLRELLGKYRALKSIEGDLVGKGIVKGRQVQTGLTKNLATGEAIAKGAEGAVNILSGDVRGGVGKIGGALFRKYADDVAQETNSFLGQAKNALKLIGRDKEAIKSIPDNLPRGLVAPRPVLDRLPFQGVDVNLPSVPFAVGATIPQASKKNPTIKPKK